jgi:hypothetical protein
MPGDGRGRRQTDTCRCPACGEEFEVDEGERCELFECPRCHTPMRAAGISQTPRWGPGRRADEGSKVSPGYWQQGGYPVKECRCPNCDYTEAIEWGARCLNSICPECGARLVPV